MNVILVTGGCGFIGSHTCLLLLEKGFKIVILDSNINSNKGVIKNIISSINPNLNKDLEKPTFFKCDLRDSNIVENVFKSIYAVGDTIKAVIHFAGLKFISNSFVSPLEYWDSNVKGTINLLKAMNKYKCHNLIFSSSASIYGDSSTQPIKENCKLEPINPYGNTKLSIEVLLNDLFKSNSDKWKIANLRYFNPIGAHPLGLLGDDSKKNKSNIFPLILSVASGRLDKIKIYGNDWPTPDQTCIRDYVHVLDIANGHLMVLDWLIRNKSQIINFNFGTGKGISVLELIKTFEEVNKIKIAFEFADRRKGDVPILVADNKLAKELLGWEPTLSIIEMCRDGWNWELHQKI